MTEFRQVWHRRNSYISVAPGIVMVSLREFCHSGPAGYLDLYPRKPWRSRVRVRWIR